MKNIVIAVLSFTILVSLNNKKHQVSQSILASGQMPYLARDKNGTLHLVYGTGDSIMYISSKDKGETFSTPSLVAILPKLTASHTRGPQLAVTNNGLVMTVCNNPGDIYSYTRDKSGQWQLRGKVNDIDTIAKENLMALSADGSNAFAVWLDLRDKRNKIFGAKSSDGGKTWSKNMLVYASPDATVCECCKPSVAMKGNNVYVMFRNWLNGNRDLYLIQSSDGGKSFGQAQKLGYGNWALKGCPMDGGGLSITNTGSITTVWNRQGKIYSCKPGEGERELGDGRSCTIESISDKNIFAWVQNGEVVVLKPGGVKEKLGKGQLPLVKAVSENKAICMWEENKEIHKALVDL